MSVTHNVSGIGPIVDFTTITPDDDNDLGRPCRGILVGVSGAVKVTLVGGTTGVIPALAAGVVHPFSVLRVFSTGTTATDIIGVW